jgi:tetratricopeptide (TPR) repeat protein
MQLRLGGPAVLCYLRGISPIPQGAPIVWERRLARWLVLSVPWILAACLGGVFPSAEWASLAALGLGAAAYALHRARAGKRATVSPFVLGGLLALGWALVAAVPLPFGLVEALSPTAGAAQADLARTAGHAPGWVPLSLDAVSSLRLARRLAVYVLVFLLAVPLGRKPDVLRRAARSVGGLGTAFVAVAALNALTGDGTVLGLHRPEPALYAGAATLVNPDHAVALLGLTLPVTVGLLATASQLRSRLAWGGSAAAQLALMALTPSGGAWTTPVLLGLLLAAFVTGRTRSSSRRRARVAAARRAAVLGLAGVAALAVVASLLLPWRADVAVAGRVDRLDVLGQGLALVARSPAVGLGPGTFLFALGAFGAPSGIALSSVGSLPVQALLDFGVPLALLVVAVPAAGMLVAIRRVRADLLLAGLAVALVGFGVHALADGALELPALGALFFALFGLLLGATDDGAGRLSLRRVRTRWLAALAAGVAVAGAVGGVVGERVLPRRALVAWEPAAAVAPPVPIERAIEAGRFYPLDGRAWSRVGTLLREQGHPQQGLAWLQYAARVMPQSAAVLQALAAAVRETDPAQHEALLGEIVLRFWRLPPALANPRAQAFVVDEVLRQARLRERPRGVLGDDPSRVVRYVAALEGRGPALCESALGGLLRDYAGSLPALLALDGPLRAPGLATLRSLWLATLFAEHADAPETWMLMADDARARGDDQRALAHLLRAHELHGGVDPAIEARLVDVSLALHQNERAARAVAELDGRVAPAERDLLRARLAVAEGRPELALGLLAHVLLEQPSNREALTLRAEVLLDAGRWREAREVFLRLFRLTGDARFRQRADDLQRAPSAPSRRGAPPLSSGRERDPG